MSLSELMDPEAVLRAVAEYDSLGEEAFLAKYGFGANSKYWLEHGGRRYQSKAIAGAAHSHQTGRRLANVLFSGGKNGAAAQLERLGFTVTGPGGLSTGAAFELLWNSGDYDWMSDGFQQAVAALEAGRSSTDTWWTGTRTSGINPGDRLFLFHVGNGLMASAYATGAISPGKVIDHNGEEQGGPFVPLEWDAVLEPQIALPWSEIVAAIPSFPRYYRGAGQSIKAEHIDQLEDLWSQHVDQILTGGAGSVPSPGLPARYKQTMVRARLHQAAFRRLLLQHQVRECVICGITQVQLLDAAHIIPDADGGTSDLQNGRLMCANHHRAHDCGLFVLGKDGTPLWAEGVTPI